MCWITMLEVESVSSPLNNHLASQWDWPSYMWCRCASKPSFTQTLAPYLRRVDSDQRSRLWWFSNHKLAIKVLGVEQQDWISQAFGDCGSCRLLDEMKHSNCSKNHESSRCFQVSTNTTAIHTPHLRKSHILGISHINYVVGCRSRWTWLITQNNDHSKVQQIQGQKVTKEPGN